MILPKLYALFDKKWQVRLDAARMILKTLTTKDLPDFMQHLPQNEKTKMALSEPIAYGSLIMAMDPQGGPKPRDALNRYLPGGPLGAKLTAAGSYFASEEIRCERTRGVRGGQDPRAQMRARRPVRVAVRRAESGWIAGERDQDRDHRGRIHPMVHRAVAAVMRRASHWAKSSWRR